MRIKIYSLIFIAAAVFVWIGCCFGHYVALKAGEKRKANIAYLDAKVMLSAVDAIEGHDYEKAISILSEVVQFRVFYIEATEQDLNSMSLVRSILRPDITIGNFASDLSESFLSDEVLEQLKTEIRGQQK